MGSLKKWFGYALMAAAVIGTIFVPAGAGFWYKLAIFGAALGGSLLLNQVAKKEMAEQLSRAQSVTTGLQANTRSGQTIIPLVYGRQKIGHNVLYLKTAGSNNQDLYMVVGLCEGEIDAIEEVWFNDALVWEASLGTVIYGQYYKYFDFDWRPGTYNQTHFSQITAIDADFEDRYKNTAVAYLRLRYDQNVYQGLPLVNFVLRGRKAYDPRDTNTKWTQTGPLQFRDVWTNKRFGCGISAAKLDDTEIGTAATYAEVSISRASNPISVRQIGAMGYGHLHYLTSLGYYVGLPFNGTFPWGQPCPTTVSILSTVNGETFTDNGAGVLTGSLGGAGTVDYSTGAVAITALGGSISPDGGSFEMTARDGWRAINKRLYYLGVVPGTVTFSSADETVTDNGAGVLTGSLGGAGTINYTTGVLSFTFKLSVPSGDWVIIQYQSDSSQRFLTNWFASSGSPSIDALRELLSQFRGMLVNSGGVYKLLIDKPGSSVASFKAGGAEASTDNIEDGSFSWNQAGISEIPTRIRAKWIDPMDNWKVKDYPVDLTGIGTERREVTIELYSCTRIDVVERIARTHAALVLQDIKCDFKSRLASLVREPGDIVDVTTPSTGWSAKKFRVVGTDDNFAGEKVSLALVAYADACYIDDPQTTSIAPPTPVSGFDQTAPPPQVTGLSLLEFWRLMNDGTYSSWIKISFTIPSNYAYYDGFEIYMRRSDESADWRWIGETKTGTFEWGPVRENVTYSFKIISRNVYGVRYYPNGPVAGIKPTGKTGTPTAPTFNSGASSFTDRVVLNWNPIADKDLGNYEVRTDLNWGNATNRMYIGKATSFWMQAASASYTFYIKSLDTSGNYSSTYDSITLANGAPTAPSPTTDYIGRDCIVKWGASPDLDFSKWVLTIYSDAARTILERTVEMQSPGFTYTYDQIQADFGGAGVPGTIYFRIVTHDIFGSTTTTDFSATQASPAIVQYDGGSVERVRIGDLGSGAFGARFKDSAGNITFEQGDTLKQKYMKIDAMRILKSSNMRMAVTGTAAPGLKQSLTGTGICSSGPYIFSNVGVYAGESVFGLANINDVDSFAYFMELLGDLATYTALGQMTNTAALSSLAIAPQQDGTGYYRKVYVCGTVSGVGLYGGIWTIGGAAINPAQIHARAAIGDVFKAECDPAVGNAWQRHWWMEGSSLYYSRTGTSPVGAGQIWNPPSGMNYNGAVIYNATDNRWIYFSIYRYLSTCKIEVAISNANDPTTITNIRDIFTELSLPGHVIGITGVEMNGELHLFMTVYAGSTYKLWIYHALYSISGTTLTLLVPAYPKTLGANVPPVSGKDGVIFVPLGSQGGQIHVRNYIVTSIANKNLEATLNSLV